jgi:site-specific recombinase XerD
VGREIARREISVEVREETVAEKVAKLFLLSYKDSTARAYRQGLRSWFAFCRSCGVDPFKARRAHVDAWIKTLGHLRPATLAKHTSAVRNFYTYAIDNNVDEDWDFTVKSPVPTSNRRMHLPPVSKRSSTLGPDKDEARLLVKVAARRSLRDELIMKILLHQGLRVSELCALDVRDVWQERGHHVWRLQRKGGKEETQAISPAVVKVLQAYVGTRESGPLVLNNHGDRLKPGRLWQIVKAIVKEARTRRFHPHSMRHACTTMLLDQGVPLRDVQVFMGHSNPDTTQRYDLGRKILDQSPAYALSGVFD